MPAFPFLIEVLETADEKLAIEILDILLGFAVGVSHRYAPPPDLDWLAGLRMLLEAERWRFEKLEAHPNEELSGFAESILKKLAFVRR